ncbi:MAG: amidohydrolase family protein [Rariglobus sp.]
MAHLIDWHSHFLPRKFVDLLRSRTLPPQIKLNDSGQEVRINEPGGAGQVLKPVFITIEERLRANDAAGVERQILSLPGLGGDDLPVNEVLLLAQSFNDGISRVVAAHPDRFSALATLPWTDVRVAAAELERAHRDLGLLGAIVPVDALLSIESAREILPVLEVAERWRSHLFIHPGSWRGSRSPAAAKDDGVPFRSTVIDLQGRIASAFATLAYSDLLKPFPSVSVQIANLGGALPFYVDRLLNVAHERHLPDPITPLRRFYVDTGSQGTRSVELAASVLGADRLLFGTDDPVFSLAANARSIDVTSLRPEQKRQILSENGRALLGRPRRGVQPQPGTPAAVL